MCIIGVCGRAGYSFVNKHEIVHQDGLQGKAYDLSGALHYRLEGSWKFF